MPRAHGLDRGATAFRVGLMAFVGWYLGVSCRVVWEVLLDGIT